jgi:beta-phosphoglucomutase-like phosphatase (HAD superfamily)
MDGVIVDSEPIHGEAFRIFLNELNLPFTETFIDDLVGHSVNHNIKTINETYLSHKPLDIEKGVRIRNEIYLNLIAEQQLSPMEGIEDLLLICQSKNIKIGLASSSVREQIDVILNNLSQNSLCDINFKTIFDVTVAGNEVSNKKPAPDIYQKVTQSLGVNASNCIAIEDSGAGILSAKATGMFCIALRNKYLKPKDSLPADLVINSIREVVDMMGSAARNR